MNLVHTNFSPQQTLYCIALDRLRSQALGVDQVEPRLLCVSHYRASIVAGVGVQTIAKKKKKTGWEVPKQVRVSESFKDDLPTKWHLLSSQNNVSFLNTACHKKGAHAINFFNYLVSETKSCKNHKQCHHRRSAIEGHQGEQYHTCIW